MAATFNWAQSNGAGQTVTALGASGNLFNFKANDSATPADFTSNPITAGSQSMEVWLRAKFETVANKIDNLQFWRSTNFTPNTDLTLFWGSVQAAAYATPVSTDSSIATTAMPTADPATANVPIGGSLSGSFTTGAGPFYSDYIVIQLDVGANAVSGDTSVAATFTLQYDES